MLGGLVFDDAPALAGNSDADVVLHALTDAVSGVTGVTIIGPVADELCKRGITDSAEYLKLSLERLDKWRLTHVSIALECLRPKIEPKVEALRANISYLLSLPVEDICITSTTGEGLTGMGRGEGIHATVVVTAVAE
ncbi:MAG: 2-C-methyl-D-erythritol 2,4-cyclodiphosphate synthase [Opitutia bacterium UBA7350]|nr:MAG: 2-C-methyl-D-erythritol 2,4-cyclodiphosphate synthase [Opitutae bacterium UBA7350]